MALPVCQFVDRVGTGAVQRLNLNDGQNFSLMQGPDVRPGPDFSPPKLKRAVVNTLLVDGASIPASAYDNRIIRLPLRVRACDEDEMAAILETLHRELDRANNVLKWHPTYNFRPVYFRTFRSPDYRLDQTMEGRGELVVTLALVAEPFGYGDREELGEFIIDNDPASGGNPQYLDISGILGDIPTPIYCSASGPGRFELLSTRRHGTPANMIWAHQVEGMTQDIDTAIQANDATASGPGMNWSQTTFADPTMRRRLYKTIPAAGNSLDWRGTYRLFVRVRPAAGGAVEYNIQARFGAPGGIFATVENAVVNWTGIGAGNWALLDLGLVPIPLADDPRWDGYSGLEVPTEATEVELWAERVAGAISLDWDYLILVPADEELAMLTWGLIGVGADPNIGVVDGPNDVNYRADSVSGAVKSTYGVQSSHVGSIPLLAPSVTNRLFVMKAVSGIADQITTTTPLTISYWPRYLYVR